MYFFFRLFAESGRCFQFLWTYNTFIATLQRFGTERNHGNSSSGDQT
jgi:hypothetical protein